MENGSIQVDWVKPEPEKQINKEDRGGVMKNVLIYVNLVIMLILGTGLVVLLAQNHGLQKEIKEIKETLVPTQSVGIQEGATSIKDLEKKLSSVETTLKRVRTQNEKDTLKAREKIDKLESAIVEKLFETAGLRFGKKNPDSVLVTRGEVRKMVQEELKKAERQEYTFPERKSVTIDELAEELELTHEQKLELQKALTEAEEKAVRIIFGIKDVAQMQEFKAKIINIEHDPELQEELTEKAITGIFENMGKFMPMVFKTQSQIRNILGKEKANKFTEYDVDTQSELSPALKVIEGSFSFGSRRSPEKPTEEKE